MLFGVALGTNYFWLAVIAVINSVISVFYYLNLVRVMYFVEGDLSPLKSSGLLWLLVSLCLFATLLLGVFPNLILR